MSVSTEQIMLYVRILEILYAGIAKVYAMAKESGVTDEDLDHARAQLAHHYPDPKLPDLPPPPPTGPGYEQWFAVTPPASDYADGAVLWENDRGDAWMVLFPHHITAGPNTHRVAVAAGGAWVPIS